VRFGQVRLSQVRLGEVRLDQVWLNEVSIGYVRSLDYLSDVSDKLSNVSGFKKCFNLSQLARVFQYQKIK
jgi:hypothetical protein